MKVAFKSFAVFAASGLLAVTACNSGTEQNTTLTDNSATNDSTYMTKTDSAGGTSDAGTMSSANPNQDAVNTLVTSNEMEMAWLQAGINNGTSGDVKSHAKQMLADHKKLGSDVAALITKKGLTKPTADTTGAVNLTEAKGKEWDKAWNAKMVEDHAALLENLNKFQTSVTDEDLKTAINSAKPVVQKHLDMAKMMQAKM